MNAVYRALSDPTRRRILALLREGDLTAGELAARDGDVVGDGLAAEVEEALFAAVMGDPPGGAPVIFDDQYISSGGQLYELLSGHDRFVADLRPYFMDALEDAKKTDPTITLEYIRSRRFSSDHCGFYPRPEQIPRMAKLGMYISCGGNVLSRSYPWLETYGLKEGSNAEPADYVLERAFVG